MIVSVSAYQDADLLDGCLESIRETLGSVSIQVVDGAYRTWPGWEDAPNSTDMTGAVCEDWGADHDPAGPFVRERDKHVYRVEQAPEGEWCLLLDADERLLEFDRGALNEQTAYQPRIANSLVYGPAAVYWPRLFKPEWVQSINRWDAYLFDVPCEKTDAVTILHRHDLRDRDYREAKYERFGNEGRRGRYEGSFETYLNDDWGADFSTCPRCGSESVTRSQITNHGPNGEYSYVEACVNGDGCYAHVEPVEVGEWRYLPDAYERGFAEDPARLRLELMDAGCPFVGGLSVERLRDEFGPVTRIWIEENLTNEREPELFA